MRIDSRSGVGFCVKYAGSIVDLQKIRQTRYSEACMDPGFFFPEGVRGIFMFAGVVYGVCVWGGGGGPRHISAILFCKKFEYLGRGGGLVQPPALIFIETCEGNPLLNKLQYFLLLIWYILGAIAISLKRKTTEPEHSHIVAGM